MYIRPNVCIGNTFEFQIGFKFHWIACYATITEMFNIFLCSVSAEFFFCAFRFDSPFFLVRLVTARSSASLWPLLFAGASSGNLTNTRCRHMGQNRDTKRLKKKCRYHVQLVFNLIFFGFVFSLRLHRCHHRRRCLPIHFVFCWICDQRAKKKEKIVRVFFLLLYFVYFWCDQHGPLLLSVCSCIRFIYDCFARAHSKPMFRSSAYLMAAFHEIDFYETH